MNIIDEPYVDYSWINKLIMRESLCGNIDSTGPIIINWRLDGQYLYVLTQDYTGKWHFCLFICKDDFHYERNKLLYPSEISDDPHYVYDYYCDISGTDREIIKLESGEWVQDLFDKFQNTEYST